EPGQRAGKARLEGPSFHELDQRPAGDVCLHHQSVERLAAEREHRGLYRRPDRRGARDALENPDLAEVLAGAEAGNDPRRTRRLFQPDLDLASTHHVEPIGWLTLAEDRLAEGKSELSQIREDLIAAFGR